MATLGLDLGTSAVKALVLDSGGRVVAVASAPCRVDRPRPGWAEADPSGWLTAAGVAVRAALEAAAGRRRSGGAGSTGSGRPGGGSRSGGRSAAEPIERIGLAGQMHGVGPERGAPGARSRRSGRFPGRA